MKLDDIHNQHVDWFESFGCQADLATYCTKYGPATNAEIVEDMNKRTTTLIATRSSFIETAGGDLN